METETNITCEHNEISSGQSRFLEKFGWWMEMCGNLPVSLVGVVLNCVAVVVLSSSTMRSNFFNRLLICLAIFDNIYLLCEISEVFRHRYRTYGQQHIFVTFVYPLRSVFMSSSIYMTVCLTLERHYAITSPMEYRTREASAITKPIFYYVVPFLTFTCIYYIPKWFDLYIDKILKCEDGTQLNIVNHSEKYIDKTIADKNCTLNYPLVPTMLRVDHHYMFWYINISNWILTALIPLVVLIYLNYKIYLGFNQFIQRQPSSKSSEERSNSQRQELIDVKKVFILFSIAALFILCHSLRIILNIDELINLTSFKELQKKGCHPVKFWSLVLVPINQLLIIINSSAHFFIYVFVDKGFQQVIRHACIPTNGIHLHNIDKNNINTNTTRVTRGSKIRKFENIELSDVNVNSIQNV